MVSGPTTVYDGETIEIDVLEGNLKFNIKILLGDIDIEIPVFIKN